MEKLDLAPLWDMYGGLLTDTQRDICNLYFNLDLTVSEIAAERGASRQAISECIKTCAERLSDFEERCGALRQLKAYDLRIKEILREAERQLKRVGEAHPEIADELADIMVDLGSEEQ